MCSGVCSSSLAACAAAAESAAESAAPAAAAAAAAAAARTGTAAPQLLIPIAAVAAPALAAPKRLTQLLTLPPNRLPPQELSRRVTSAMQEAHSKSVAGMKDKMQGLARNLGLPGLPGQM